MGMLLHRTLMENEAKQRAKECEKPVKVPETKEQEAESEKKSTGRRKTSK